MCTAVLIVWDPRIPPPPAPFGLIYEVTIGQPRWRYLFLTPWSGCSLWLFLLRFQLRPQNILALCCFRPVFLTQVDRYWEMMAPRYRWRTSSPCARTLSRTSPQHSTRSPMSRSAVDQCCCSSMFRGTDIEIWIYINSIHINVFFFEGGGAFS